MPNPQNTSPCTQCGIKDARNYITRIVHGVTTQSNLCDDCFAPHQAVMGFDMPKLEGAVCDYCASPAAGAGLNSPWEQEAAGQRFHYTCLRCTMLKVEVMQDYISERESMGLPELDLEGMVEFTKALDDRIRRRLNDTDGEQPTTK